MGNPWIVAWIVAVLIPVCGLLIGLVYNLIACHLTLRQIRALVATAQRHDADRYCAWITYRLTGVFAPLA